MWCIEKIIYIFSNKLQRFHPKSPFYEIVKMTTKQIVGFESFVTIGSFGCDHAPQIFPFVNAIMSLGDDKGKKILSDSI